MENMGLLVHAKCNNQLHFALYLYQIFLFSVKPFID